MAMSEV